MIGCFIPVVFGQFWSEIMAMLKLWLSLIKEYTCAILLLFDKQTV